MKEKLTAVCTLIGILGAGIAEALGGWDKAIITLLVFMAVDFVTGMTCALVFGNSSKSENGALSSKECWRGLVKKFGTLLIVIVAHYADLLIGSDYIPNAVVIGFCASELISICENAGLMGILPPDVQKILEKVIDILKSDKDKESK